MPEIPTTEHRRAPRIPSELLVMIEGLHDDYRLARGNISSSGVLLELSSAPGSPGDLELLHLATPDFERRVDILGQIVRCVTVDAIGDRPRVAVAFEFLPDHPKTRTALTELISRVALGAQEDESLDLEHRFTIELEDMIEEPPAAPKAATVFRLQVERMLLETTWPVTIGDRVQLTFRTQGSRLPFEGLVSRVAPLPLSPTPLYEVEVKLAELGQKVRSPNSSTSVDSIDVVMSELLTHEAPPPQEDAAPRHLSGRLERIPITSLLTFLEMERQSGRISVEDGDRATLYIDGGRVVDVAPETDNPVAQIAQLMVEAKGRFDFTCEPVEREDRIGRSTTHLLLDLAREQDEADQH